MHPQKALVLRRNLSAFSSEVDAAAREENASNDGDRAAVLIQSEPIRLWCLGD